MLDRVGLYAGECSVTWGREFGYMMGNVLLHSWVLDYMIGSAGLPGYCPVNT